MTAAAATVTVTMPASAALNPAAGTTTTLSVRGEYAGAGGERLLLYKWAAAGPGPVKFSPNTTNAAKSTTATFGRAGSYVVTVVIGGPHSHAMSRVKVIVNQTLSSIALTPGPNLSLTAPATQQFKAKAFDQFGNALAQQPAFIWSFLSTRFNSILPFGSITLSGLYSTGGKPGTVMVKATSGGIFGSVMVTVKPAPVVVTSPAIASPNPVTINTTNLSVHASFAGYGFLSYLWSADGPGSVTFFPNATKAATNTYAVFTQAGVYDITVMISNGYNVKSSSVTVKVNATPSSITVTPGPTLSLTHPTAQQFTATATDQFGHALSPQPAITWSLGSGSVGSIDPVSGLFSSGNTTGNATVTATSGSLSETCAITVN